MNSLDVYHFAGRTVILCWPLLGLLWLWISRRYFDPEVSAVWTLSRRIPLGIIAFALGWMLIISTTVGAIAWSGLWSGNDPTQGAINNLPETLVQMGRLLGAGLVPVLAITMIVKLYEKWVNGRLSDAERQPGITGFRAWGRLTNLFLIVLLAASSDSLAGFAPALPLGVIVLCVGLFLAYPLIKTITRILQSREAKPMTPQADLSPQRERVLRLLEDGKITADEAAELISALNHTLPNPNTALIEPWTPARTWTTIGAAIVVVAFFLPWFVYDPGVELSRATQQMVHQFNMPGIPQTMMPSMPQIQTGTVSIAGGDVSHGLGWICLALSLASAAAPVVATGMTARNRRMLTLTMLAAGAFILLYLLTSNLRYTSFGLPLALLGYTIESAAVLRTTLTWSLSPRPTQALA